MDVEIDTQWNVNTFPTELSAQTTWVEIDTQWNVNGPNNATTDIVGKLKQIHSGM